MHQSKINALAAALAAALAGGATAAAENQPTSDSRQRPAALVDMQGAQALENLERAAQRLRDAAQTMAQQPAGAARDHAMSAAHRALFDTSEAMRRLPARYRAHAGAASFPPVPPPRPLGLNPDYYAVQNLRVASDRLYDAVHALARERNQAGVNAVMRRMNAALVETQGAMAWAFERRLASTYANADADTAAGRLPQGSVSTHAGGSGSGGAPAAGADSQPDAVAGGVGSNVRAKLSDEPSSAAEVAPILGTGAEGR